MRALGFRLASTRVLDVSDMGNQDPTSMKTVPSTTLTG
jgi:hypothetical protein